MKKKQMKNSLKETHCGRLFESQTDKAGKKIIPVVIIGQGLGNVVDRHYYTEAAIKSGAEIYEGRQAYLDHPTPEEEEQRPGRSVKELCGHYEDCKAVKNKNGLWDLHANFRPIASKADAIGLIEHSVEYSKKYPDKDFIGISINGSGDGEELDYEEFISKYKPLDSEMEKIKQIEGKSVNVVTKFTDALSADIVTAAGARGRILKESQKRRQNMFSWMKNLLVGAEKGDQKMIEEALKNLKESKTGKAVREAEAGAIAKHVLACKKETPKKEEESEEEYETKMLQSAMEKADKEDMEKKEKDAAAAKSKDSKDEDSEESEGEGEGKKAGEGKAGAGDDSGDEGHPDADKDKALFAKMLKKVGELEAKIEAMEKGKAEAEEKAKKAEKENAKTKIEAETQKRLKEIDQELAKSGLPRYASEQLLKVFVEHNTKKEERSQMIEAAKKTIEETRSKEIESIFRLSESGGFPEMNPESSSGQSNDDIFKKKEE